MDESLGQLCDAVVMVRPTGIAFNPQTEADNRFQRRLPLEISELRSRAAEEFRALAAALREAGIEVLEFDPPPGDELPDAVFPNNWISFHAEGTVCLYPMAAENRRRERQLDLPQRVAERLDRELGRRIDLTGFEERGEFLEGTGSMVLDRVQRVAYACLSPRTSPRVLDRWCEWTGFRPVLFRASHAAAASRTAVYHTNVLLSIGRDWAIVCSAAIDDADQRRSVLQSLRDSGRDLVEITPQQMERFAGNVLQLRDPSGQGVTVASASAAEALEPAQLERLSRGGRLLVAEVPTIEACGGGSVRCMLAEVFLPRRAEARIEVLEL